MGTRESERGNVVGMDRLDATCVHSMLILLRTNYLPTYLIDSTNLRFEVWSAH